MIRLSEDFCLACGESFQSCECGAIPIREIEDHIIKGPLSVPIDEVSDPLLGLGFEVPNQPTIQEVNDWIIAHQDKQAFATLYEALQKARDILQRGIREGERGHKKALHDAAKVLGDVT